MKHELNLIKADKVHRVLFSDFPTIFDHENPIPLKIGIYWDVCAFYKDNPNLSNRNIKVFFRFWTQSLLYKANLKDADYRYDLNQSKTPLYGESL